MSTALLLVSAYLLGSLPFGHILVKAMKHVDVRSYGSHNIGAINVCRVAGWPTALASFLLDGGKGFLVSTVAATHWDPLAAAAACMAVLVGHAYSAYFLLVEGHVSGGKSVATGLGVIGGLAVAGQLSPWVFGLTVGIWLGVLFLPRLVGRRWPCLSLATLSATLLLPVWAALADPHAAYQWLAVCMTLLVVIRHKGNIQRLLQGTELRPGRRQET